MTALRYLLDTNICIYIRQKRPANVFARMQEQNPGDAGLSIISYGELSYGVAKSADPKANADALSRFVELIPVLLLPVGAGEIYGEMRAALESDGSMIGSNDLWIAAHALASGLTLVTNNVREFRRVPKLKIENWAK